jgi:hypothetical protein
MIVFGLTGIWTAEEIASRHADRIPASANGGGEENQRKSQRARVPAPHEHLAMLTAAAPLSALEEK